MKTELGPIRVLLVEANREDAARVQRALDQGSAPSFSVVCVGDLGAGAAALQAEAGFDLVLSELNFPDRSGSESLRVLKSWSLPVVLLTSNSGEVAELASRVSALLFKSSFDADLLIATLRSTLIRVRAARQVRQLVTQSLDGTMVLSKEGEVRFVNPAGAALFGRAAEELVGEVLHLSFESSTRIDVLRPDGTIRDVDLRVGAIDWDGEPSTLLTLRDVSAQTLLEARLRESERLEAIGRLAGGVAHDFNNMLTAIVGNAELATQRVGPEHAAAGPLQSILSASRRSGELIERLMAFGRQQLLKPEIVDVNAVVGEVRVLMPQLVRADVYLVYAIHSNPLYVLADAGQLLQALVNLITNASQAMPTGGRLTLTSAEHSLAETPPDSELPPGDYVRLGIQDTGVGMSPEVLAHVFEPFYSTRRDEGSGLGLASVHGFVSQSGGEIRCSSQPDQGTIFEILLPRRTCTAPSEPVQPSGRTESARGEGKILVAEDEPAVRQLLEVVLSQVGYEVVCAADGIEALAILEQEGDQVSLLVTDIVMPRMGGLDLAERARERLPELPIAFMSGYSPEALTGLAAQPGVPLIRKPLAMEPFLACVRATLEGRSPQ